MRLTTSRYHVASILSAAAFSLVLATYPATAQTSGGGGVRSGGGGLSSGGLGSGTGLGSSSLGGGLGASGGLSGGLGGSLGGTSLGGTGLGGTGLGGTGLGSSGLGMGSTGLGSTGSFSGNLSSTGLGFNGVSSIGSTFGGGGYGGFGGGLGGASGLNAATSAARFAGISSSNLFSSYYANPLAGGLSTTGGSTQARFGSPLYTINATTTGTTGIGLGRGMTGSASTMLGAGMASYGSSTSTLRPGIYQSPLGQAPTPLSQNVQPRADLQQIVARSSSLSPKDSIQVLSDGDVVVLRGTVVSEYDRRFAEALVRLSPGTRNLVNELKIAAPTNVK